MLISIITIPVNQDIILIIDSELITNITPTVSMINEINTLDIVSADNMIVTENAVKLIEEVLV